MDETNTSSMESNNSLVEPTIVSNNPSSELLLKQSKQKLKFAVVIIVLLSILSIVLVVMTIINANNAKVPGKEEPLVTPTISSTSVSPTSSITETPLTPVATTTPVATKTLTSTNFSYSFDYPSDWTVVEVQGYPIGPSNLITSEEGYMHSANNNVIFDWTAGDPQSDGGEHIEWIAIGTVSLPCAVTQPDGYTVYSCFIEDTALGFDVPKITRFKFVLTIKDGENIETAKNVLKQVVGSIKLT